MNIYAKNINKDIRKYELVKEKEEFLHDLYNYLPNLVNYLWDNPKFVSYVLQNSDIGDIKNHLAPLFVNNFYENILSSYFIEDNLVYVLTMLLKNEIDKLNSPKEYDKFLNDSPCGCLLEEFRKKIDIKKYLKTIISDSIKDLEEDNTNLNICFDTNQLEKRFNKDNEDNKEKKMDKDEFILNNFLSLSYVNFSDSDDFIYQKKARKLQEIFNQKYITSLSKSYLKEKLEIVQNNKKMCDFINSKILECNENELLFSNQNFIDVNIYKSSSPQIVFILYQNYFMATISFIELIMRNIIRNIQSMPYSIKIICKIISLLITKKFPSISEIDKNAFISKFFFEKLIIPAIVNPGIEAFISDFIISQKTLDNLKIISEIMHKFTLGEFYISKEKEICFTPFNLFFLEKMDNLFKIFENIIKVNLPLFIDKFINNELSSDYHYDYFIENPDEIITHRSILFNLEQVKVLLLTIDKLKKEIFFDKKYIKLEKTVEKLMNKNNQNALNSLISLDENKSLQELKTRRRGSKVERHFDPLKLHYFLITSFLYNEKYKSLFEIEQNTPNFTLKELNSTPDEKSTIENNIIKVKNFFSSLLYNNNKLVRADFEEGKMKNTKTILMELKNFMKSSYFVVDESIPFEWYFISLLEYLEKIPSNLTENDCEELYNQFENDVKKSIKELDFDLLSLIMGKLKYSKRINNFYDKSLIILNEVKLNNISKNIIEKKIIPVDLVFKYDDEEINHIFQINTSNFKIKDKDNLEKIKDYEKKQKVKTQLCLTINDFTKKFPNLVRYQEFQDIDVLNFQSNLEFPKKINHYISLIREYIKNSEYFDESIMEIIYDYIMSKIYNKIYPIEPYEQDTKIYQKSIKLSWIKLNNLAKMKLNLVFGSFLSDVANYFNLIDSEKSPNKKIFNVSAIFNSIRFLLKFNGGGKDVGVDDQMPLLNYAIIKLQPLRMYSNAKFMELYIGDRKNKSEGNQLTQLLSICEHIIHIDHSNLIDVSPEEFNAKSNASAFS